MNQEEIDAEFLELSQSVSKSDHDLLEAFRSGQMDASTRLYMKYADRLIGMTARKSSSELAAKVDPEDIVQSVFRTFFRRVEKGQYDVPEGEDIWKLLLVITLNKIRAVVAFNRAAKRDMRRTKSDAMVEGAVAQADNKDEIALATLRIVIDELLADQIEVNQIIIRQRIEGYDILEIAKNVNRSKRTVERVLQGFRARLSQLI
ncbi:MAG: RNA polymerase sigma factor [Isosphaeraceae bacterium]